MSNARKKLAIAPFRPIQKKPCGECPFRRKGIAGWLGRATPESFVINVSMEIASPCHTSIDYEDPAWESKWRAGEIGALCRGALIYAANCGKIARNQAAVPRVDADDDLVFSDPHEFVDFHRSVAVRSWEIDE